MRWDGGFVSVGRRCIRFCKEKCSGVGLVLRVSFELFGYFWLRRIFKAGVGLSEGLFGRLGV